MTSRVWRPTDPVEPRMATRFGRVMLGRFATNGWRWKDSEQAPFKVIVQGRQGEKEAVQAVCKTTMSGNEAAAVLHAQATLKCRFRQVADLGGKRKNQAKNDSIEPADFQAESFLQ